MQKTHVKRFTFLSLLGLALSFVLSASAQLQVSLSGLPVQTFSSQPAVTEWSTRSVPGAGNGILNAAALDAAVQTNSASMISAQLNASNANPPNATASNTWSSSGLYIHSRPTGNSATLLLTSLRNNTGTNVAVIDILFDLTSRSSVTEELPGFRIYFSLTGATGTWQNISGLSGDASTGSKRATVNIGNWTNNTSLYLLWADDNGDGSTDTSLAIDNFAVTNVVLATPMITSQPQNQSVIPGATVSFSVTATGPSLNYQWRKNGTNLPVGATSSTYTINNAQPSDNGTYSVVVSNPYGSVTSSNATLVVSCSAPAAIVTQPVGQNLQSNGTISLTVSGSGTAPLNYQWYRNDAPIANATNQTYTKSNAQYGDSGYYRVVLNNCWGTPVSSSNVIVSVVNPAYTLVGLTNYTWKYDATGTNLFTTWTSPSYNDSAWSTGLGVLAHEDNAGITNLIHTDLPLVSPVYAWVTTNFYFRTSFVLNEPPGTFSLLTSNLFDDGIVVYVNGKEAYRMNMPSGNITATTFAPATTTENVYWLTNIAPELLVKGTNVIAVEAHQVNATSSDIVMGMHINVVPVSPSPLAITNDIVAVDVEELKTATFTVGVSGNGAYYQWYKNGSAVSNGIYSSLTFAQTSTNDAGSYYVVASNAINSVTSSVVALTVRADTNAPTLVYADGTLNMTNILVSFSEFVDATTATATNNYKVTNTLGGTLTVSRAVVTNGTNVLLTTAARTTGNNYIVIVNGVTDIAPRHNVIVTNSMIPVAFFATVIPWEGAYYDYYEPQVGPPNPFADPDPDQGTAWRQYSFTLPFYWTSGNAPFFYNDDPTPPEYPFTPTTAGHLSQSELLTAYFRCPFNLNVSPGGIKLQLRHFVDDGAVFYLNGNEVLRYNMATNLPITYDLPSASQIGDGAASGFANIDGSSLQAGGNVLAVELHQWVRGDHDLILTAEMQAIAQSYLVGPVMVLAGPSDKTAVEGQSVTFSVVEVAGQRFQWQQNGTNIVGATNADYTISRVPFSFNGSQFKVLVYGSGSTNAVSSTNATLRISYDTNAPTIVSGYMSTSNNIHLTFSEPMLASTVTAASNYKVTNSAGAIQTISSITVLSSTDVLLNFTSLPLAQYWVVANGLRDASVTNNLMWSNTVVKVGFDEKVLGIASSWRYDQQEIDRGTNWTLINYDDSSWSGTGQGLFDAIRGSGDGRFLQEPVRTQLVWSNANSATLVPQYYFRTHFNSLGGVGKITLHPIIDDGAVVYLNGVEIWRTRVSGAATYPKYASASVGDASYEGPYVITVSNLVNGDNVLSASIHQVNNGSSDATWGAEVWVTADSVVTPGTPPPTNCPSVNWTIPNLSYAKQGTNLVISWVNPITNSCANRATFTLEGTRFFGANAAATPWLNLGTSSPVTLPMTNSAPTNYHRFFRLRL